MRMCNTRAAQVGGGTLRLGEFSLVELRRVCANSCFISWTSFKAERSMGSWDIANKVMKRRQLEKDCSRLSWLVIFCDGPRADGQGQSTVHQQSASQSDTLHTFLAKRLSHVSVSPHAAQVVAVVEVQTRVYVRSWSNVREPHASGQLVTT